MTNCAARELRLAIFSARATSESGRRLKCPPANSRALEDGHPRNSQFLLSSDENAPDRPNDLFNRRRQAFRNRHRVVRRTTILRKDGLHWVSVDHGASGEGTFQAARVDCDAYRMLRIGLLKRDISPRRRRAGSRSRFIASSVSGALVRSEKEAEGWKIVEEKTKLKFL